MDAALVCAGQVGYRNLTVAQIYEQAGSNRSQFYQHFPNKADCFGKGYERQVRLLVRCLASTGQPDDFRNALEEVARFIADDPARARAMLIEVHVVDGEARRRRREALECLARALDRRLRKTATEQDPPAITAEFMISAIEQAATAALLEGDPAKFRDAVPALEGLVLQAYRQN
jgi:AcrR family transcriptional regulator